MSDSRVRDQKVIYKVKTNVLNDLITKDELPNRQTLFLVELPNPTHDTQSIGDYSIRYFILLVLRRLIRSLSDQHRD